MRMRRQPSARLPVGGSPSSSGRRPSTGTGPGARRVDGWATGARGRLAVYGLPHQRRVLHLTLRGDGDADGGLDRRLAVRVVHRAVYDRLAARHARRRAPGAVPGPPFGSRRPGRRSQPAGFIKGTLQNDVGASETAIVVNRRLRVGLGDIGSTERMRGFIIWRLSFLSVKSQDCIVEKIPQTRRARVLPSPQPPRRPRPRGDGRRRRRRRRRCGGAPAPPDVHPPHPL